MTNSSRSDALIAGFGPICTPELRAVGIDSVAGIRELGWEEAYLRWVERFPARINSNAACAMIAAERGISWLKLDEEDRRSAKRLVALLRKRRDLSQ
jgi:hypothetical protein